MRTTEETVRLALDWGEHRIGHDGTIKASAEEITAFAEWLDEHPDLVYVPIGFDFGTI